MKPFTHLPSIGLVTAVVIALIPMDAYGQWQTNGAPIVTVTDVVSNLAIVSDGTGGTVTAWEELRDGESDWNVYAQRLNAGGVRQWPVAGVAVCAAVGRQEKCVIVSDGAGGAIAAWQDARAGSGSEDIYAQRVDASGTPLWTADGVPIGTAANSQLRPAIVSDGAGGGIIAWYDTRNGGGDSDVFAQRVNASGVVQWTPDGIPLSGDPDGQGPPVLVSDGSGGAVAAWSDDRSGALDIYAQRVSGSGVIQWLADGVPLTTAAGSQEFPAIVSDGTGGAIVSWADFRSGADIYAQRINGLGTVEWTVDGDAVCSAAGEQGRPHIVGDGAGGAIVSWTDNRDGVYEDVYAQRINGVGVAQWATDGVVLCNDVAVNLNLSGIVSDGAAGAVVTWYDFRFNAWDVFAQRVNKTGVTQWIPDGTLINRGRSPAIASDGFGGAIVAWQTSSDAYARRVTFGGSIATGVSPPTAPIFSVKPNTPNPFSTTTSIDLVLPNASDVGFEVFDVRGRRVRVISGDRATPGPHRISFDGRDLQGRPLPSGVYFYRITASGATVVRKMVITR